MTIDHIMIKVKDWPKAKAYYEQALKPLGYDLLVDGGTWGGFTQPNTFLGRIYVKQGQSPYLLALFRTLALDLNVTSRTLSSSAFNIAYACVYFCLIVCRKEAKSLFLLQHLSTHELMRIPVISALGV